MKLRIVVLLMTFFAGLAVTAQENLIPDGGFEEGEAGGSNNAYYTLNWKTIWRAWPFIGFQVDTEVKNSGERSLKLYYENYGSDSYTPAFRTEAYPPLEDATYLLSFYYKTDIDRSDYGIEFDIREGVQGASTKFFEDTVQIVSEAKDGFVKLEVEFKTGKAMESFIPYIRIPFIAEGAYMHIDDASLVKVVNTPEAWGPSPENDATEVGTSTSLSWQKGKGAVKHNVYLGSNAENLVLVAEGITDTQYKPEGLTNETTYFWRVDEVDAEDNVATGSAWQFSTITFFEEYMQIVKTERVVSDTLIQWTQFGPGNSGFSNFVRYHPTLPDVCITSPDMFNTYITEDNAKSWVTCKDVDGEGDFSRLYDLFFSTTQAEFGIAIESSRLYISQDTGRCWQNVKFCPWYNNDGEGNDTRSWYRKVSAVAVDPASVDTWYVGAGNFCRGQQQLWSSIKDATHANPRGVDSEYMGTIWKTSDAGKTWSALTSGIDEKAQFSRIIVHPENSNMVFAASQYGLYRSEDGGASWANIGEGKIDNNTIMNMDYYYNSETHEFTLYVADQVRYLPNGSTTRCTGGIFESTDNGETWKNINGNLYLNINQLTGGVSYNYYQYIVKWFGISTQEAQSTYPALPTKALQYFNSLSVDQSRKNSLYVGFYDAQVQKSITPGRLWKTENGGSSWINVARDYAPAWENDKAFWMARNNPYNDNVEMGHQPSNQQWGQNYPLRSLRYADVNSRGDVMIIYAHNTLLSTDRGETFKQVDEDYTEKGNIMARGDSNLPGQCMFQDKRLGEGILFLGTGEHHLWRTTLDGTDDRQAVKYLNGSQESVFAVVTHPWDENTVYTTSMRQKHLDRIFKSTDRGDTFEDWGKATSAAEWMRTNHLRIDPLNPEYMYFGVTEVAGSGGGSGNDGPDKDKEGGFHKSTNAGKSFTPSNSGMPSKVWVRDIEFDPRDSTRKSLFAAAPWNQETQTNGGLFHSSNRGASWTEIVVDSKLEGINNVCFDHTGRMYVTAGRRAAGLDMGGVWFSDDFGTSWTQIFDVPYADNFDVSPFDHNRLVFTVNQLTKNPGIYLSEDRGKTWSKNNNTVGRTHNLTQVEFDLHDASRIWLTQMGSGFYTGEYPNGTDTRKITVTPGTHRMKQNEDLQLSVQTNGSLGTLKYKSANKQVATVSESGLVLPTGIGAVKIWVTSEDGRYSDFVYLVVEDYPDAERSIRNSDLMVYPNPSNGWIKVKGIEDQASYRLFSLDGRLLTKGTINTDGRIDLSMQQKGMYILTIRNEKIVKTIKLELLK